MVAEALGDRRAGETVMLRQVRTTLEATAFAPVRSHSAGNRLPLQPYETHMPQSSPPQTAPSIGYQVPPLALAPAGGNSMQAEGNLMQALVPHQGSPSKEALKHAVFRLTSELQELHNQAVTGQQVMAARAEHALASQTANFERHAQEFEQQARDIHSREIAQNQARLEASNQGNMAVASRQIQMEQAER